MRLQRRILVGTALLIALMTSSCSDDPQLVSISIPSIPAPFNLSAVVGGGVITLSWASDPSFTYSGFVV